jgi:hypothetical protein
LTSPPSSAGWWASVWTILRFSHPNRWHYDVLRALDYFRCSAALTGAAPDPRLVDAVALVGSKRLVEGSWPLDGSPPGRVWFEIDDGAGKPSRWLTLRALRVLRWWDDEGYARSR